MSMEELQELLDQVDLDTADMTVEDLIQRWSQKTQGDALQKEVVERLLQENAQEIMEQLKAILHQKQN